MNENIQNIAFPRLTGSDGEKRAQSYLYNYLKRQHLPKTVESIEYKNWTDQIILFRGMIFSILLILNLIIQFMVNSIFSIGLIFLIWLGFQLWPSIFTALYQKYGKEEKNKSKNISAQIFSQKNQEYEMNMSLILLIAHYDSAGKSLSLKCSSICERLLVFNMHSISIIILIFKIKQRISSEISLNLFFYGVILFLSIVEIGLLFLLRKNILNNKSPGIKNNAMGVSCYQTLLEEIMDKHDIFQWSDIVLLFPGAEEQGLYGKRSYFNSHRNFLQKYKDLYVFDLKRMGNQMMYSYKSNIDKKAQAKTEILNLLMHHLSKMKCPLKKTNQNFPEFQFLNKINNPNHHYFLITSSPKKTKQNILKSDNLCALSNYQIISDLKEFLYNTILSLDKRINDKIEAAE